MLIQPENGISIRKTAGYAGDAQVALCAQKKFKRVRFTMGSDYPGSDTAFVAAFRAAYNPIIVLTTKLDDGVDTFTHTLQRVTKVVKGIRASYPDIRLEIEAPNEWKKSTDITAYSAAQITSLFDPLFEYTQALYALSKGLGVGFWNASFANSYWQKWPLARFAAITGGSRGNMRYYGDPDNGTDNAWWEAMRVGFSAVFDPATGIVMEHGKLTSGGYPASGKVAMVKRQRVYLAGLGWKRLNAFELDESDAQAGYGLASTTGWASL